MILTVCMSPSVDVTVEVDALNVGKTNIVKGKSISYTGKAINVAIGVSRLGRDAYVTGFLYEENGAPFLRTLDREGVRHNFVWSAGRVRENFKCIDRHSMLTEVNDVGGELEKGKTEELLSRIRTGSAHADVTVISGGLPRGVDASYYEQAFCAVAPSSLKICDAVGGKLFAALEAGVDLVKPNRDELESSLGREFHDKAELLSGCRELIDRGAKTVLLSLGKEGAVITNGSRNYYCKSINVAVNSTVGAGDGMVAAAAVRLAEGADLEELLRAGVAGGTATVTTFDTVSFAKKKFDEIYAGLTVKEI